MLSKIKLTENELELVSGGKLHVYYVIYFENKNIFEIHYDSGSTVEDEMGKNIKKLIYVAKSKSYRGAVIKIWKNLGYKLGCSDAWKEQVSNGKIQPLPEGESYFIYKCKPNLS